MERREMRPHGAQNILTGKNSSFFGERCHLREDLDLRQAKLSSFAFRRNSSTVWLTDCRKNMSIGANVYGDLSPRFESCRDCCRRIAIPMKYCFEIDA